MHKDEYTTFATQNVFSRPRHRSAPRVMALVQPAVARERPREVPSRALNRAQAAGTITETPRNVKKPPAAGTAPPPGGTPLFVNPSSFGRIKRAGQAPG